jgi:dihydroflavonol-4-reductase
MDRPVLVTGAGGFVGGHVARELARLSHAVRGLTRRPPVVEPGDPAIDWRIGDLRDPCVRAEALRGAGTVIHAASWVSLGPDPSGNARILNVDTTRALLTDAAAAGVRRFVYTSTLHTLACGTAEAPADEDTPWNLERVDSPYARTKCEAERLVLEAANGRIEALALCPGMVIGPRDVRPTSTRILRALARTPVALVPGGGIPLVDATVVARAHEAALTRGEPGRRYAIVGPYVSYPDLARLVGAVAGFPRWIIILPDPAERPLAVVSSCLARLVGPLRDALSPATIAGGFLRLHVRGDRGNAAFGLIHPSPLDSIRSSLK